jgi:DNA-binding transcriptional ArsR family regulator
MANLKAEMQQLKDFFAQLPQLQRAVDKINRQAAAPPKKTVAPRRAQRPASTPRDLILSLIRKEKDGVNAAGLVQKARLPLRTVNEHLRALLDANKITIKYFIDRRQDSPQ